MDGGKLPDSSLLVRLIHVGAPKASLMMYMIYPMYTLIALIIPNPSDN